MKRDWDLIRKQLTDIEEEKNVLSDIPEEPVLADQGWEAFGLQHKEQRTIENRILGHLELLINNGYVDGLTIKRSPDGMFGCSTHNPRLTMAGHDLLDTMRSTTVWEEIKSTAKTRGIELTFDAIKSVGAYVLKLMLQ